MKDRMERIIVLPFAAGCVSAASIDVCEQRRKSKPDIINSSPPGSKAEEILSSEIMKRSFKLPALPKSSISTGFQRLFKSFKSFSESFVFKEEMQEVDMDMEIGDPTDVKHVTHIGIDGSANTDHTKDCDNLIASEFLSFHSLSFTPFELSMAAQSSYNSH